ncbi:hypothetical protein QWY77_11740 [Thalassotalea ponticola]|uniref:hypothetical protein n=1 Tax=Thalassotalea ponticola TaxID=1523392 RepID=UPI0025B60A2E|nr:hypothetical protein [Thalassotalea ponticola]MDN3653414.1 hypothetical protein [Thalassotalea ponticola]
MTKLKGMTINERLFVMNKINNFNSAIRQKNIEEAIAILEQCELSLDAAKDSVAAILRNPKKYGY